MPFASCRPKFNPAAIIWAPTTSNFLLTISMAFGGSSPTWAAGSPEPFAFFAGGAPLPPAPLPIRFFATTGWDSWEAFPPCPSCRPPANRTRNCRQRRRLYRPSGCRPSRLCWSGGVLWRGLPRLACHAARCAVVAWAAWAAGGAAWGGPAAILCATSSSPRSSDPPGLSALCTCRGIKERSRLG